MKAGFQVLVSVAAVLLLMSPLRASDTRKTPQDSKQKQGKAAAPAAQESLNGCIDERETGHYILIDDTKLSPIAELHAEGFPIEGFAKYLGQKVTVRGKKSTEGSRTVFTVRKIETVAETCTPSQPPQ